MMGTGVRYPVGSRKADQTRAPSRIVSPVVPDSAIKIALSPNIASGGEATTDYGMTAPAGKSGAEFFTGRRWDDENGVDSLTPSADGWTKIAWAIIADPLVVQNGEQYEFRIIANGAPLNTYNVTPQWTIGTAGALVVNPLSGRGGGAAQPLIG